MRASRFQELHALLRVAAAEATLTAGDGTPNSGSDGNVGTDGVEGDSPNANANDNGNDDADASPSPSPTAGTDAETNTHTDTDTDTDTGADTNTGGGGHDHGHGHAHPRTRRLREWMRRTASTLVFSMENVPPCAWGTPPEPFTSTPMARSVRFHLAHHTYDAPPWGVREAGPTKSRKRPTRKILPLFCREQMRSRSTPGRPVEKSGKIKSRSVEWFSWVCQLMYTCKARDEGPHGTGRMRRQANETEVSAAHWSLGGSRAVQFHPHGVQFDFAWLSARTPHWGASYAW